MPWILSKPNPLPIFSCSLLRLCVVSTNAWNRLMCSKRKLECPQGNGESSRHVAMVAKFLDLNKPWYGKYGKKKMKNWHIVDFPLQDCTHLQTGSTYFSFIVQQCKFLYCHRRLMKSKYLATMVMWCHTWTVIWPILDGTDVKIQCSKTLS